MPNNRFNLLFNIAIPKLKSPVCPPSYAILRPVYLIPISSRAIILFSALKRLRLVPEASQREMLWPEQFFSYLNRRFIPLNSWLLMVISGLCFIITFQSWDLDSVCQWCGRPGFNPRSCHTKDFKNGTWYLLA